MTFRPALARIACLLTLLASFAVAASAQEKADQLRTMTHDELAIVKVLTAQENAWNRGDIEAFATGYKNSPDTIFIGSQISHGYAQMLNDYKRNYPNRDAMGTLAFSELEPHMIDDHVAIIIGRYHLDRNKKAGGNADGIFSLIFEKTDVGWKIIVDHTTS
jgi:ketosteroid isomerase-like protein